MTGTYLSAGRGGNAADVVYVLCLMQAAFLLLAGLGETVLMGADPVYLVLPVAKMALLFVLAAKVVSGRTWALITMIVVQGATIVGFWLQLAAGLIPQLTVTVNLVGLLTNLALPFGVICLCAAMLAAHRGAPARLGQPAPAPVSSSAIGGV